MKSARIIGMCVLAIACSARRLEAQDLSHYRDFALGSSVVSVSTAAGVAPTTATTTHERPALLQALEYRPSYWVAGSNAASTDPVAQIAFAFCDDQLFRIVVDYSRERTEGMTPADMIEAISAVYGPAPAVAARARGGAPSQLETESGTPIAQWGDSQHTVVLYRASSYGGTFRLLLTDLRLADLARKADMQAVRLDDREAPQREIARQQKERDDEQAAAAKTRGVNKDGFKP